MHIIRFKWDEDLKLRFLIELESGISISDVDIFDGSQKSS